MYWVFFSSPVFWQVNADGWPDLLFANHHRDGSHRNTSFLYWGGPEGFSPGRRLELPADGPHLMTVTDHGNVYDRSHRYSYIHITREGIRFRPTAARDRLGCRYAARHIRAYPGAFRGFR